MRFWASAFLLALFLPSSASAGAVGKGKVILDLWDVAFLEGVRAGFIHTKIEEVVKGDHVLHVATVELRLTVKRFKDVIQLSMDTGTIETKTGKVVGTVMRQLLGKGKELLLTGIVQDNMLHLTEGNVRPLRPAPWNDEVVGLFRQQLIFQEKDVKPGDKFSYPSFEPSLNIVIKNNVIVKDYETVELFAGKEKAKLLRVEIHPPVIEKVKLSPMILWLKEDRLPIRTQFEIPGLGKVVLYRTTKANALAPTLLAKLPDIGVGQYVRLKRPIPRPDDVRTARYRITIKDDDDPASTFSGDDRQTVKSSKGSVIELEVEAGLASGSAKENPGAEFLDSSYFINCSDVRVKELARRAVGRETDPWRKALAIERWVNKSMKVRSHEALATADHVARTLEGDCTEFAMLTAAMCRAEGIPSRTAVGLIYADVPTGPVFAFHMWTEVWVAERWAPLDATLGRGRVGATHLKITDQSWHEARNMTPLFPVIRVLGRIQIEVVGMKY